MVEGKDSRLESKIDSCSLQDPQQRGRSLRPRPNRTKNQWRPISGVLDVPSESQIHRPVSGEREDNLWKPTVSDGEEEIVWSGREKLPEPSQGLGIENLTIHENSRGIISKNTSPRGGLRRAPVSYKGPACGPYVVPIPGPSYLVPLAGPLYKENRDGFEENPVEGRFKENLDFHQHKPPYHDLRTGPRADKKGVGGWHPQPQIPHFGNTNDFLGLPSVPYYPGQETAPELLGDPFHGGPPCYDYGGYHRGQYAPGFDFLGVHTTAFDNEWRSLYGYSIPASKFAYDNTQAGGKQQCSQSNGSQSGGKRDNRGARAKKVQVNRTVRGGKGKGRVNRKSKRGDSSFTIINVGDGSKRDGGTESENSNSLHDVGLSKRHWKPSQEAGKDIFVSQPFSPSHDRPQTINVGATEGASIAVVNNGTERLKLLAVKMLYSSPKGSFSISLAPPSRAPSSTEKNAPVIDATKSVLKSQNGVLPGGPWVIGPGSHLTFKLGCAAMAMGLHRAIILFDFGGQKIVRYITLICEDDIAKAMAPIEPYIRLPRPRIRSFYKFVPGIPPPLPFFKKRLEFYPMPADVKEAILKKETLPVLTDGLRKENYSEYFSTLVFAEELQMEVDIRAYDMQNVNMWKVSHSILGLHVPGLAERRPSVIYRDKIYVRPSGTTAREFQGYVHKVQACEVHLRFSEAFHKSFIYNSRYDIRFSFGRVNIRRAHQGIQAAKALLDSFLFPSAPMPTRAEPTLRIIPFSPFNRTINAEQRSAVSEILKRKGAPPYLIYGPPGTGKTVTVVEAILQIRKAHPNSRILACAPSNSASDLLLERLMISVEKRDMLRLNAYTRSIDEVAQRILPYCLMENNFFCTPDQASLMKYHVVVTTYWSAAMLDAQEIQPGHFTHIFLDEAGQGTEPEAMVPIANLANSNTVVVLAGDHQQLGPLIRSPVALKYGLDKSYLERLSSLTTYLPASANGASLVYNNSLVTKLVRNYRSHPAILDLPSRLFYDGELVACADESRNSLVEWDELPNNRFPVLFIGIEGRDEREGTSPSWFNAQEASRVVDIVKKVKDYRRSRVNLTDIGVISPYNQQVSKLKKALASQSLGDVKVGSVESFQGQEKRVIIISTVRSSKDQMETDKKHNLGFLTNPKRFNVAITRAKALLIIVGNPHVLCQDRCWNELLRYCRENNSYIGCTPPSEDLNEESKQLHSAIIDDWFDAEEVSLDNDGLPASLKAAVEDPQWPDGTC